MIRTSSNQIAVEAYRVDREDENTGRVSGSKINLRLCHCDTGRLWTVWFRDGEPILTDGCGRPHPKLVLAAARAAWMNGVGA